MDPFAHSGALAAAPAVLAITPFERPDLNLLQALARSEALGVLDLGRDIGRASSVLEELQARPVACGVRVHRETAGLTLPDCVVLVVLPEPELIRAVGSGARRIVVQVCSLQEARDAAAQSVDALIVKGNESGGRVGDESAFVLLQRIASAVALPLFVQGGIGLHSAGAAIAGGARGVVLDSQLALTAQSRIGTPLRRALARLDGSEPELIDGHQRLRFTAHAVAAQRADEGPLPESDRELACGQDIALASALGDRYRQVERLIKAVRRAAVARLRQARALLPLAEGSPFARAHGARYPLVQGPMTRVSDRPEFAAEVARAGAIPFVALSLLRGDQASELIERTATQLSGHAWGVGILGFAPPELREEQLALIRAARPPLALIAGGRPAQARALQDAGIDTFLHVPSPGLLAHFLADGARRFVFEGRECGGHVGPRSSFVLWEQVVQVLLESEVVHELELLFAGGIHDARSAAMVSAMAAPLCARGARVGALMGTAYLFTEEAVSSGAIVEGFQRAALECESTALLHTAPGHATRAAHTVYVGEFERARSEMVARGADRQAAWADLESLNVGRLRLASKGIARDGERMLEADRTTQQREGLFMMGQVAALRSQRTTLAALHDDASAGSARWLQSLPELEPARSHGRPIDIAIVGMGCVLPDAPDLGSYWRNILTGRDCIREIPASRWDQALYYDAAGGRDRTPSKWGGFVPELVFEPQEHGIPPNSVGSIDPGQLLALHVVREALRDARIDLDSTDRDRCSVIFGAEHGTEITSAYVLRCTLPQLLGRMPEAIDAQLPELTEDSFPGVLANVIAGRISNRMDFGGVNYTVNAACASSLAALDAACKELVLGHSDLVVAGAADVHNGIYDYLMFASVHALSPRGRCKTFDAQADGIVLGEGVAAVVLKRLADAQRDGDRIYGVLKAVAGSSDGRGLGLTAPRKEGQQRALERAYDQAGIAMADIGLIEAHGTGTVVGDRTELEALTELMVDAGAPPDSCTLGSVKSQIGHTKCTAGFASLIKVVLSSYHGVLPPTLGLERANAYYRPSASPFSFRQMARPWFDATRRAGVSAFGFGGTNFHAVLESAGAPAGAPVLSEWPAELFVLRGASIADAHAAARALMQLSNHAPERYSLLELAAAAARWRRAEPVRFALVADSVPDLHAKLEALLSDRAAQAGIIVAGDAPIGGKVAFVFPGQGSQRPHALAQLFVLFPAARRWLEPIPQQRELLFPPQAFDPAERAGQRRALADTRVAQPVLAALELAAAEWLAQFGVKADMAGGHSFGELTALAHAGVITDSDLFGLARARADAMVSALGEDRGAMAAVSATPADVERVIGAIEGVVLANFNSPEQVVISGASAAVGRAVDALGAAGLSAQPLDVGCAFHSPLMQGAERSFAAALRSVAMQRSAVPVFSNATAQVYGREPEAIRKLLADQLIAPVRFEQQVRAMYEAGARIFVEVGPGRVLSKLIGRTLGTAPHRAVALDGSGEGLLHGMLASLGELAVAGVPIDLGPLFAARLPAEFDLETAPAREPSAAAWLLNGQCARPLNGPLPKGALRPLQRVDLAGASLPHPAIEAGVVQYLQNMQALADDQRRVMLTLLGADGGPAKERVRWQPTAAPSTAPVQDAMAPAGRAAASDPQPPRPADLLVAIVSERTGYPIEMLDLDLDLEADLGIDSIKRVEIVSTLVARISGPGAHATAGNDRLIEALSRCKTLRTMQEQLAGAGGQAATGKPADGAHAERPAGPSAAAEVGEQPQVHRFVMRSEAITASPRSPDALERCQIGIVADDRGVAQALVPLLAARGAHAFAIGPEDGDRPLDVLIHLEALNRTAGDALNSLFARTQAAVRAGAKLIVGAAPHQRANGNGNGHGEQPDPRALGLSGFLKSVALEHPSLRTRLLRVDLEGGVERMAQLLADEVGTDGPVEVHHHEGQRRTLRPVAAPLTRSAAPRALGPESVLVITGGARGITARVAIALARRFGCALELIGRSPEPPAREDPRTASCIEPAPLRRALIETLPPGTPARDIETTLRRIQADREARATFAAICDAGSALRYHAADVRDAASLRSVIEDVYARHGRITGVIHGAGVIEDALLLDKTPESFARVFTTKVQAALTLADALRDDTGFLIFFASVSGVFGNRGQTDYAAANAGLDQLAYALAERPFRVLSIDWGPWSDAGMLSPELAERYRGRGIELIAPALGVESFIAEIEDGCESQVILAAAPLPSFAQP